MRQLEGPVSVEAIDGAPIRVANLDRIPPQPLFSEVRSVLVGPHARIVGYHETLFREPVLELGPGSRLADVDALKLHERVQSMRMDCIA
jgi:hypothetical protein